MYSGINLDDAPPYSLPFSFFSFALIASVVGGFFLIFSGVDIYHYDRTLSQLIHIFTIGFIIPVSIGALSQMIPVIVGKNYLSVVGIGFISAIIFMNIGIGYGLYSYFYGVGEYTLSHIVTIFMGYTFLLILSVAYKVVPMFWVASEYPNFCKRYMLPAIVIGVVAFNVSNMFGVEIGLEYFVFYFSVIASAFASVTLKRLKTRKRKVFDIAVIFWMSSMIFLFISVILINIGVYQNNESMILLSLLLYIFGFVITLMFGMMYKIVPFLAWFHLISKGIYDAPTIADLLPKKRAKIQGVIYSLFFITLFGSYFERDLLVLSGSALIISSGILIYSFLNIYREFKRLSPKEE